LLDLIAKKKVGMVFHACISNIWEAEVDNSGLRLDLCKNHETLSEKKKKTKAKSAGGVAQMVECACLASVRP
jgi:hypothetical protein